MRSVTGPLQKRKQELFMAPGEGFLIWKRVRSTLDSSITHLPN